MLFYLQERQKSDFLPCGVMRGAIVLIKDRPEFGYEVIKTCEADEWLLAKRKFGLWLTPTQERLLASGPLPERLKALKDRCPWMNIQVAEPNRENQSGAVSVAS